MLRFILNFFIFGFIFFLIWKFQPGWIDIMKSWADAVYNIIAHLATIGIEKIKDLSGSATITPKS